MSLTSIANIIRLKPSTRSEERPRFAAPSPSSGPRLLARATRNEAPPAESLEIGTARKTVVLGLDFGSSHTSVVGELPGVPEPYLRRRIPSAIALPTSEDGKTISPYFYFGDEATNKGPRFQKVRPWRNGDIDDPLMARELARHVRDLMRRSETLQCRAVVAEPGPMSPEGKHHFRQALRGLFEQAVFLPRAYLAALGLKQQLAEDSANNAELGHAILIDLGAGSTEGCLVGKSYPTAGDLAAVAFGGDHVEAMIQEALRQEYPAFRPERSMVRCWKDEFGFVGEPASTVVVKVPLDTVERQIVLTGSLRRGCEAWLVHVAGIAETLYHRGTEKNEAPRQIFLTGGGSRLVHLVPALTTTLAQRGIGNVEVQLAPEGEISLAAIGALHAARKVREDQWPRFTLS